MKKNKLICFVGAPASGKSTLASGVHTELKRMSKNSIFVGELATDFIAEYGIPNNPTDQMVIFYKQLNRELMYINTKEYTICDSSSILNYFYFRNKFPSVPSSKDIAAINHMQKEILKSIGNWSHIFYVPPMDIEDVEDGIRYHNADEIKKLDRWIRSYLEIENIKYTDLSDIDLSKRVEEVVRIIC